MICCLCQLDKLKTIKALVLLTSLSEEYIINSLDIDNDYELISFLDDALKLVGKGVFREENRFYIMNTISKIINNNPNFKLVCFECFLRELKFSIVELEVKKADSKGENLIEEVIQVLQ